LERLEAEICVITLLTLRSLRSLNEFAALVEHTLQHRRQRREICAGCVDRLQTAVALYQGPFLAEIFLKDSCAFDEWALVKRDQLGRLALSALHDLGEHYRLCGDVARMEQMARRQIEINPFQENAHRQMMRALDGQGHKTAALAHYRQLERVLAAELQVSPERKTRMLRAQIQADALGFLPRPPKYNWPAPLTPFVGRQQELARIAAYLQDPAVRLLTLSGPAGVGKTRLALQAAAQEAYSFNAGACFVPLASLASPEYIVAAAAGALGLPLTGRFDSRTRLLDYLRPKEQLLVLDDLEAAIPARTLLSDILRACPALKIVVTARESLNLPQERLLPVAGMAVPAWDSGLNFEGIDAVELFLERARRIRPDFALNEVNWPAVIQICRAVEGLPLALELAASWINALSCQDIAHLIISNGGMLTAGRPECLDWQIDVRAVLDHIRPPKLAATPEERWALETQRGRFCADYLPYYAELPKKAGHKPLGIDALRYP
jgi:hypothetical protein